ncbi:MAG: hypothetical protein PF542_04025 [Nanoarchaeota archaeon]|nr:hypothetical protein [Nanoarchaeota archaeon]
MRNVRGKIYLFIGIMLLSLGFIFAVSEMASPSEVKIEIFIAKYLTFNGTTTDFNTFNESALGNLSNVVLEKIGFGKVEFSEALDVLTMAGDNWIVDFDTDVNISDNLIYVDTYNLAGINKKATLTFFNIIFPNPVLYKKGIECSDCNLISYSGDIFVGTTSSFDGPYYVRQNESMPYCGDLVCNNNETFGDCPLDCNTICGDDVCEGTENAGSCLSDCPSVCGDTYCTGNETYASCSADCDTICGDAVCEGAESPDNCLADCPAVCGDGDCNGGETSSNCLADCPAESPSTGGGGGGGGGSTDTPTDTVATLPDGSIVDFFVTPTLIEASIDKGTYVRKTVTIENNGTASIGVALEVEGVTEFVFPAERSIYLDPGEKKTVRIDIYFSNLQPANIYLGTLKYRSSVGGVFRESNLILNLKDRAALFDIRTEVLKRYVNPGGRVRANVSLINMGDLENFDVSLEYKIMDFQKNDKVSKEEQFAINKTYSNIFFLDSPKDLPIGDYIFYATVRYQNINATSYDVFTIERLSFYSWILLIMILLVLMYLTYRWYVNRAADLETKNAEDSNQSNNKNSSGKDVKSKVVDEELPQLY